MISEVGERWYVRSPGLVLVLVMHSSPIVVLVMMMVGAHRHPWVVDTPGCCGDSSGRPPSLVVNCRCHPSLWGHGVMGVIVVK